jgi:PAS domain-containing protein
MGAPTTNAAGQASARDGLLRDLARRQPVLAATNLVVAALFAAGFAGTAPAPALAAWGGCIALAQVARLALWRRWPDPDAAPPRPAPSAAALGLLTASAASGLGWGLAGVLFGDVGDGARHLLVPFFLAGMAAGAVATLHLHLPSFYAFVVPALAPYAVVLALHGGPVARVMALTTAAYAAALATLAHQAHRSARRAAEGYLENARLVGELDEARRALERRVARRAAELETIMDTVPAAIWLAHDPEGCRITGSRHAVEMLRLPPAANASLSAPEAERPRHFRLLRDGRELRPDERPVQRAARGEVVRDEELRVAFDDGTYLDELVSAAPVRTADGAITGAVGAAVDNPCVAGRRPAVLGRTGTCRDVASASSIESRMQRAAPQLIMHRRRCGFAGPQPPRVDPARRCYLIRTHHRRRRGGVANGRTRGRDTLTARRHGSWSSGSHASAKSGVPKPSVNRLYTAARRRAPRPRPAAACLPSRRTPRDAAPTSSRSVVSSRAHARQA